MDFVSNKETQINEMLAAIGIQSIDKLFSSIPEKIKLESPNEDDGLSEYEGIRLLESIASKNTFPQFESYLGAGAYEHYVPALVGAICSKSEFLTAYTPYQPEASQGMLQIIFEFQSSICALTGMDVSNASVYDGASACAEAILMALRLQKDRKEVIIAESLSPFYRKVVDLYLSDLDIVIKTDLDKIGPQTAAVLIQNPNFFGVIEDCKKVFSHAKQCGALSIVCANPLVYGLYETAAELGADIAVGDCQPFGIALQFGGPYAGYMACRQEFVRQMPGRIAGKTVDTQGREGYVLTLQAREQQIRREKATSNICTNQALAALASLVAILWYGKEGVKKLALTNFQRASYLREKLRVLPGISLIGETIFNEFTIQFDRPLGEIMKAFRKEKIEPGLPLENNKLLIAVTETKTKEQLDRFVSVAEKVLK